ncbi:uncharacterized protein PV06_02530 [Exophiala oligosperma]|uniref:Uncharacterized protein n=1 Tax=Exophiala oligosperma TaxID=215243 RepID=A0A0D2EG46_9EURO|nr:uncharacterized protein PV06_02530 [Exophiala oligosperma]KIW46909.1 hypothetical protein PV06_02530 [Exophiala oligosperma]
MGNKDRQEHLTLNVATAICFGLLVGILTAYRTLFGISPRRDFYGQNALPSSEHVNSGVHASSYLDNITSPHEVEVFDNITSPRQTSGNITSPWEMITYNITSPYEAVDNITSPYEMIKYNITSPYEVFHNITSPRATSANITSPYEVFENITSPHEGLEHQECNRQVWDNITSPCQ